MTMTTVDLQRQIDEALRRTEIDALLVTLAAATSQAEVAQALCDFINFPRVTQAVMERMTALTPAPKARKSRAKA